MFKIQHLNGMLSFNLKITDTLKCPLQKHFALASWEEFKKVSQSFSRLLVRTANSILTPLNYFMRSLEPSQFPSAHWILNSLMSALTNESYVALSCTRRKSPWRSYRLRTLNGVALKKTNSALQRELFKGVPWTEPPQLCRSSFRPSWFQSPKLQNHRWKPPHVHSQTSLKAAGPSGHLHIYSEPPRLWASLLHWLWIQKYLLNVYY